jgi:GGDEF domain-containing protein
MDTQSARHRMRLLEDAVRRACVGLEIELDVSSSMGLALYPENGRSAEELLGMAERDMYLQKRSSCRMHRNGEAAFRGLST